MDPRHRDPVPTTELSGEVTLATWPHLPRRWCLATTDHWLAIDKPSQVAVPSRLRPGATQWDGNDVLTRIGRAGLAAERGRTLRTLGAGLGGRGKPHLEDDALASGVCWVARDATSAEDLGRELAGGEFRATYQAGVLGWPLPGSEGEAGLLAGLRTEGVAVRLLQFGQSRAGLPTRALIELSADLAAPVDLLALLARRGVRIADATSPADGALPSRRDEEALRRMWHRSAIQGPGVALQAPTPAALQRFVEGRPEPESALLQRALRRRYGIAHGRSDAIRLVDDESAMVLERYGDDLVVAIYSDLPDAARDAAAGPDALARAVEVYRARAAQLAQQLALPRAWLKLRPRQANVVVDAVAAGLVPKAPVYVAADAPAQSGGERIVEEDGVRYWVDLADGLQTGLFLDQRDNRRWLRDHAVDRRVLNTFSYTCAFQVAAAVGGARRTVSIDASARALERGRRNLALNGHDDPDRHDTIRGDVFHWLPRLSRRGDRFDVVVLDPPSYARVRKRRFSAARDYAELVTTALGLLAPGGTLLASVNHAGVNRRRFEQMLRDGCKVAGRRVASLRHLERTLDHPGGRMKAVLVEVDGPR